MVFACRKPVEKGFNFNYLFLSLLFAIVFIYFFLLLYYSIHTFLFVRYTFIFVQFNIIDFRFGTTIDIIFSHIYRANIKHHAIERCFETFNGYKRETQI